MKRHQPFNRTALALLSAGSLAMFVACGSSDATTAGVTGDTTGSDAISNSAAKAYPDSVAISSPTAEESAASASVSVGKRLGKNHVEGHPPDGGQGSPTPGPSGSPTSSPTGSPTSSPSPEPTSSASPSPSPTSTSGATEPPKDLAGKREAMRDLLSGDGDCTFTISFPTASDPACYGPQITYANHPDGTSNGTQLPPGDLGIWSETEDGEACAAAKMNALIDGISSKLDSMMKLFGSMACAAHKAGLELPAAGASLTVTDAMNANAAIANLTYNSAVIERLADDADGKPVYKSTLDIEVSTDSGDISSTLMIKHTPTNDDNTTYKGRVAVMMHQASGQGGNCQSISNLSGVTQAVSVGYEKAASTDLRMELKHGMFCGSTTEPVDSTTLEISAADKVSSSNPDGWGDDFKQALINQNPLNGMGSIMFSWQAGVNDGAGRGFNMATSEAADGSASGTAYFGYTAAADAADPLSITGFYCNWAGPNNRQIYAESVQRQVLSRAAGATVFTASSSNITYAPTNSCDATASSGFTFGTTAGTADNDEGAAADVTNNLIDLDAMSFTAPVAPAD